MLGPTARTTNSSRSTGVQRTQSLQKRRWRETLRGHMRCFSRPSDGDGDVAVAAKHIVHCSSHWNVTMRVRFSGHNEQKSSTSGNKIK